MISLLPQSKIAANVCRRQTLIEEKCNDWCTARVCYWQPTCPCFINDLPHSLNHSYAVLFADDTVIYYLGNCSIKMQEKINKDLLLINKLKDHSLTLHIIKSKFTIVGEK